MPQDKAAWLPIIREFVAGVLALVVMSLFLGILWKAIDKESGVSLKDVLAIVNPVVGLVIGFYFSRATSETRAEKAETAAASANEVANNSVQARATADQQTAKAKNQADVARGALQSLAAAVESDKTDIDRASNVDAMRLANLQVALERARQVLG